MSKKELLVKLWGVIHDQEGLDMDDRQTMHEKLEEHVATFVPAWLKTAEVKVVTSATGGVNLPGIRVQPDGIEFTGGVELEFSLKAETMRELIEWTKRKVKAYMTVE